MEEKDEEEERMRKEKSRESQKEESVGKMAGGSREVMEEGEVV